VLSNLSESLNQAKAAVESIESEKNVPEEERLKFVDQNGDNPVEAFLRQAMGKPEFKAIEGKLAEAEGKKKAEEMVEEANIAAPVEHFDPMKDPPLDAEGNLDIPALARRTLDHLERGQVERDIGTEVRAESLARLDLMANPTIDAEGNSSARELTRNELKNLDPAILARERNWVRQTIQKRVKAAKDKEMKKEADALAARSTTDIIPKKVGPYKPPPGLPLLRAGPGIFPK
jgi:hypothetical protein